MKRTRIRYSEDQAREMFADALKLIKKNYYYSFSQVAHAQGVNRLTYLKLNQRREELQTLYKQIKEALQNNIPIAEMKLLITPKQARFIERNFTTRWKGK